VVQDAGMSGAWTVLGAPLDSSGAGRGEERAPEALRAAGLAQSLQARDEGDVVSPLRDSRRDPSTGVIAAEQLALASATLRDAVAAALRRGRRPLVLGGDCSVLPGALAGARLAVGAVGLWMVDGHPDALDGETSPTGEAADMDLAIVLGRGPVALTSLAGVAPIVAPDRVALIGHRPATLDRDVAAELALVPPEVALTTALDLRARSAAEVAHSTLAAAAGRPVWLHLDLDALDENDLPTVTYPQPQGLRWDELVELAHSLLRSPDLVGVSLADFEPDRDPDGRYARDVVGALTAAWPSAEPSNR
jgi:arginase